MITTTFSYPDLMQPVLTRKVPKEQGWLLAFVPGAMRVLITSGKGGARLESANGNEGEHFPELVEALEKLPTAVFDCELVVPDRGGYHRTKLLNRRLRMCPSLTVAQSEPSRLVILDVLSIDGEDLRSHPFAERHRRVHLLTGGKWRSRIEAEKFRLDSADVFELLFAKGDLSVIAKRADAPYVAGPSHDCLSIPSPNGVGHRGTNIGVTPAGGL